MIDKTIKLQGGTSIPTIGLGTWRFPPELVGEAVEYAITEAGYRHIDCASIYGNQVEVGQAFHKVFASGGIPRDQVFITSKLWNTSHHPKNVQKEFEQTLKDLQLDYLDLYLMHWGVAFMPGGDLEPLDEKGYPVLENVSIQEEFVKFCQYKNIAVTAYSPLGTPANKNPNDPVLLEDPVITKIAKVHGKSPAQVLINWALSRGTIVIPKSVHKERMKENMDVFDFTLTEEEKKEINGLNKNHRFVNPHKWWRFLYFS